MRFLTLVLSTALFLFGCTHNQISNDMQSKTFSGAPVQELSVNGLITAVSNSNHSISIKHGLIPEMNWPPMLMTFNVVKELDLSAFAQGDKVKFILEIDKDKNYRVKQISPHSDAF